MPYFRADGYWIAADYFNQPNLMFTSFQKLKQIPNSKKLKFTSKDYYLALYGLFNFGLMVYFIGYMLLFHFNEIVAFPNNVFRFFTNLILFSFSWGMKDISKQVPVLLFYFFLLRFAIGWMKKFYQKIRSKSLRI